LDFVVVFAVFVFQRSSNQPKSVHTFFFLILLQDFGVIEVVALSVLLEETETLSAGLLDGVDDMVQFGKINLVIVSNNLTLRLGLQTHLYNVSGFVVEQAVRVSQPRHCSEKHDWFLGRVVGHNALANFVILRGLALGVGGVRVHIVSINSPRHFGAL
jgi:hypothetical protein